MTEKQSRRADIDSSTHATLNVAERQNPPRQSSKSLYSAASQGSPQRLESGQLDLTADFLFVCSQLNPDPQGKSPASPLSTRFYPSFEVRDESEALLFRHFVDNLSSWVRPSLRLRIEDILLTPPQFDLTDPNCSFRREVNERVRFSQTLEEAIYAISSRHLSCLGMFDPVQADRYSEKCVESMIDLLSDASAAMDDSLLAATVILRVTEELQGMKNLRIVREPLS